jgi:hypothetical protein
MKEALNSSETSVLTRATRRDIPEDAILHCKDTVRIGNWIYFPPIILGYNSIVWWYRDTPQPTILWSTSSAASRLPL